MDQRDDAPDILEIGYVAFFKTLMPRRTVFVAVEAEGGQEEHSDLTLSPRTWRKLDRLLAHPGFRIVVLRVNHHPGRLFAALMRRLRQPGAGELAGVFFRRTPIAAPLVVVDFEDESFFNPQLVPVLERAAIVFKRELPVDRWRVFHPSGGIAVDEGRRRGSASLRQLVEKLRPLPLGLPLSDRRFAVPSQSLPKTTDVFFSGTVGGSASLRPSGRAEIERLREKGVAVDLPSEPLPPSEFYRRCATAHLTWSPQGYGWDCFRHYEAAACRSVPVINYPTIERAEGLADGRHALFYDPGPGGLTTTILRALSDKDRLSTMAESARAHVLRHHTPEAIAARILAGVGLPA